MILNFRRQDTPITARTKLAQIRQTGTVADYRVAAFVIRQFGFAIRHSRISKNYRKPIGRSVAIRLAQTLDL